MDTRLDERRKRAARNQTLFREVNERVHVLNQSLVTDVSDADFVCECADTGCSAVLAVGLDEYERVRKDPTCFFVRPGHVLPDVEEVVGEGEEYVVVRKLGVGADVARASRRRSSRPPDA